ncbi:MAG: hypothetical protein AB7G75_03975 [Candidatus Binatia bacterium]
MRAGQERGWRHLKFYGGALPVVLFGVVPVRAAESPKAMIRATVERAMAVLNDPAYQGDANFQKRRHKLESVVLPRQQEFFSSPSQAHLTVRAQLVAQQGQEVLAAQRFDIRAPAPSDDAQGGALAMSRAVAGMLAQLQTWVSSQARREVQRRAGKPTRVAHDELQTETAVKP